MSNLEEYWKRVRKIQADLKATLPMGDAVYVVTLPDHNGKHGGSICECSTEIAAKLIFADTHRAATEQEIEAHVEMQRLARDEARLKAYTSAGVALISRPAKAKK